MSLPPNRTFSFEQGDAPSFHPSEQAPQHNNNWPQPYRDFPSRDMQVSPPTGYRSTSPPPRHDTISPPSPPTHRSHLATNPAPSQHPFHTANRSIDDPTAQQFQPYAGNRHGHGAPAAVNDDAFTFPQPDAPSRLPARGFSIPRRPVRSPSPPRNDEHLPDHASAPVPAPHRRRPSDQPPDEHAYWGRGLGYSNSTRTASTTTPGMDNLGATAAGGGIAGIAMGVANTNERESGVEALRAIGSNNLAGANIPAERGFDAVGSDTPYVPQRPEPSHMLQPRSSYASTMPLGAGAASPGHVTPRLETSDDSIALVDYPSPDQYVHGNGSSYADNPYNRFSTAWDPRINQGPFNPNEIADDGDDGFMSKDPKRTSVLNLDKDGPQSSPVNGPAAGAAAGGVLGTLGRVFGRKGKNAAGVRDNSSGQYGPVPGQGFEDGGFEKGEWPNRQRARKRRRLILTILIGVFVIVCVVAAILGGVLGSRSSRESGPSAAAKDDGQGDLTKDSDEIKKLLGNAKLHKVFPGVDYTPFNAQYPACLTNPPSQNNVTRDMAVLSQLTNAVRLYGTDCNQTEMVLHSIDKLGLTDMKVWLGVWLEKNATTNDRQLSAMYDIVDKHGAKPFKGVIVGNEVLYRKDLTETEFATVLSNVRSNFTQKKVDLPLAASDLGDDWTAPLAAEVDIVMSNVHPFFAGVTAAEAAGWTWDFWQTHDVVLTQGSTTKKNLISEVGWPSGGGNNCGQGVCTSKTDGSVAGIDEMNTFLKTFVCESLNNGTDFFWFEAFDEPWKVQYYKAGQEWEDKWGLMDSGRNLKPGLVIPDCGGKGVA